MAYDRRLLCMGVAIFGVAASGAFHVQAQASNHGQTAGICQAVRVAMLGIQGSLNHAESTGRIRMHSVALGVDDIGVEWKTHAQIFSNLHVSGERRAADLNRCKNFGRKFLLIRSAPGARHERQCQIGDGVWVSRLVATGAESTPSIIVVENSCATDGWLVELKTSNEGWVVKKTTNLWYSLLEQ